MYKERVHNETEAIVLIREAYENGDEDKYDGTQFYTHEGKFIFKCHIKTSEFWTIDSDNHHYNHDV